MCRHATASLSSERRWVGRSYHRWAGYRSRPIGVPAATGPTMRGCGLGGWVAQCSPRWPTTTCREEGSPPPGCPGCWSGLVFGTGGVRWTGSGAGVLAVDGDLVLANGSSWTGLVIVSGNVTLEPASTVLGLVRTGGVATLTGNSAVDGSACAAFEALNAASSLARPIPTPARSWLGPLPPGTN